MYLESDCEKIVDNLQEGICLHELVFGDNRKPVNYRIIDVNPSYEKIIGISKNDCIGKLATEVYNTKEAPFFDIYLETVLEGTSRNFEIYFSPLDKHFSVTCFKYSDNKFATAFHDISPIKKLQLNLEKTYRSYEELFHGSRDGFVMIDKYGAFVDANKAYCTMLGFTLSELKEKKDFYDITPQKWWDFEKEEIWEKRLLVNGYSGVYEKEYIRKDGTIFPVELQGYGVKDDNGEISSFWAVVRDITDRKETENKSKKLQKELMQSSKLASIGLLASGVGHEINNPLAIAYGYVELLEVKYRNDPNIVNSIDSIKNSLERIKNIVDGLRNFSRVDKGDKESINLHEVSLDAIALVKSMYEKDNVLISTSFSAKDHFVEGNRGKVGQVIMNLLSNAKDALPPRGGTINIETINNDEKIILKVIDNGKGIETENLHNIFDSFYTTKEIGKGTGLGLSISHSIVKDMKGTIDVESQPSVGTTFLVNLPLYKKAT